MKFRVIYLPPFKAVHSGVDTNFDFSEEGKLGRFSAYFSVIQPQPKEQFMPRDFLYYDKECNGLVWMYAITEGLDTQDLEVIDFDGGLYVTYFYNDGDDKTNERLYNEALEWIDASETLELNERDNHYAMGHIITPSELIQKTGIAQMESFIPVRIKS